MRENKKKEKRNEEKRRIRGKMDKVGRKKKAKREWWNVRKKGGKLWGAEKNLIPAAEETRQ